MIIGVLYPSITKQKLLELLKLHLFGHVVRMPSTESPCAVDNYTYFTQVRGIPQGSVLSPILCNLYYGNAEATEFGCSTEQKLLGLESNDSVIVRMMDDYLMISTDKHATSHFLQVMHNTMQQYGDGVNPLKTRVNFDVQVCVNGEVYSLPRLENLSNDCEGDVIWCGWKLNARTLEIGPSFEKLLNRPIISSVSIGCYNVGTLMRQAMKSFMRPKCHPMVFDFFVNSRGSLLKSASTISLMAALRGYCYLKGSKLNIAGGFNPYYIYRCIQEAVLYGAKLIKARSSSKRYLFSGDNDSSDQFQAGNMENVDKIYFIQLLCISYLCYLKVYEAKQSSFPLIVKLLQKKVCIIQAKLSGEYFAECLEALSANEDIVRRSRLLC